METQLTIKHLAAYLPYGLKAVNENRNFTVEIKGLQTDNDVIHSLGKSPIKFIKPILRNLSDLTKEIEVNGEKFTPNHDSDFKYFITHELDDFIQSIPNSLNYNQMQKLFEWHFDIFGLIENGLAIDINTI